EAHINMALIHDNLNRPDQTEAAYLTAIRLRPQSVAARNNLALFYDTGGQTDKAVAQLREIIKIEPEWPQAHYSLGLALAADEKRLAEAVECFTKASQLDPNRPRLHYNRGLALQRLGKPEEAEQALLTARNLNLRDPDYPRALAILNVQQEQWERAEMFARAVLEVAPGDRQATALLQELQSRPQGEEEPVPEKR
ncbi:MAG: tetratricopeptide repeat protein, partial [Planctomycetes bacterium]|nr:tetratricopeptide repeat protein [Planctomycetota bacterium]